MDKLQDLFVKKGATLSLAESCTGGLIASMLTSKAGSSQFFKGSFVTYCNDMKIEILGVDPKVIEKMSAVSKEVAKQMCEGALRFSKSDYAIAVTGDAGPGGDLVGVVFGAVGNWEEIVTFQVPGLSGLPRNKIREKCADFLLENVYTFVKNKEVDLVNQ